MSKQDEKKVEKALEPKKEAQKKPTQPEKAASAEKKTAKKAPERTYEDYVAEWARPDAAGRKMREVFPHNPDAHPGGRCELCLDSIPGFTPSEEEQ